MVFFLGAMMGSFINVVGLRFLREESIIFPASRCYNCNHKIKPYDNVPIISWLILKGRCRHCKTKISIQYPLIEFLTGFLFVATVYKFGFDTQSAFLLYLICNFMVIFITDFREKVIFSVNSIGLIPFGLTYTFLNPANIPGESILNLGSMVLNMPQIFISALMAVVGAYIIFLVLNLISKLIIGQDGFGEGDTYLLMGIGSFLGLKGMLWVFVLSFIVQAVIGIPVTFWQWWIKKAYKSIICTLAGFSLAFVPYILQLFLIKGSTLLILTLICAGFAIFFAIRAIIIVKQKEITFTFIPFGPTIVMAALLLIFFETKIIAFFRVLF